MCNIYMKNKFPTINRDISWMYFNRRILNEAANASVPLIERLKFLGIYSSNLDEFFRVRVATLRRMVEIEEKMRTVSANSKRILKELLKLNERYTKDFEHIFSDLVDGLERENIFLLNEYQLNPEQEDFVKNFYQEELHNSLFPILVSRMSCVPVLNDQSIYLAVKITQIEVEGKRRKKEYALIEIPVGEFTRFLVLPQEGSSNYIMFMDDVIRFCLPQIFASLDFDKFDAYTIKFTRDAEMEFDNSSYYSLLEKVSKGVKSRKTGIPIRFVFDRDIPSDLLRYVEKLLNIDRYDAHVSSGRYHNLKDLISFPKTGRNELRYQSNQPVPVHAFEEADSVIELIRKKDRYLHYPYHSFDNFIRLLRESAIHPDVKEIKISIYRLAKNSKVVQALMCAAMNGKKVTAMVELMARFDEKSNINWAKKMQDAGIKVIFGLEGLKVHSKLAHIKTKHGSIACIGTGNFHEGTSSIYTDFTLMTAYKEVVEEVEQVFNFLEQPYLNPVFKHLIVSPVSVRKRLCHLIKNEIDNARKGKPAYILCKINHIVDEKIIQKLYQASQAGVKIKLLVRGNCSLIPGVPGLSENIEAYGIIDRYLEHSRILVFANGGHENYFIGSADWMARNLDNRVEVYVPVYDSELQKQLRKVIEYGLRDNVKARIIDGTDKNELRSIEGDVHFRSQEEIFKLYQEEYLNSLKRESVETEQQETQFSEKITIPNNIGLVCQKNHTGITNLQ